MASQNMAVWRNCIRRWYPNFETETYFVPPVVITRIPFDEVTVAGQPALVPQCNPTQSRAAQSSSKRLKVERVQDSDTRDDLALQKVLFYFRELVSEQSEPMFVISQLQFSSYLGEPCYAAAAKHFLRPQNLPKDYRKGDFDILVIHRHYGIITGEIKSVLSNQQQLQLSQPDVDRVITDRVRIAIKQLNKSEVVLREITKDLEPTIAIRKLLILPYVTPDILTRVISSDQQLKQDLVTCLKAVDFEQALHCCLLAFSSETETANNQQRKTWWSTFNAFKSFLNKDLYLDLLARFCGPATTVSVFWPTSPRIEIRTEGQGVAVTGERMTSLVLTPEQISLLTRAPTKVLLTGPPGVGKTMVLVLMALTWLRQGHDVHLVSVMNETKAATRMINHVIQMSLRDDPTTPSVVGSVHVHEYDFHNKVTDVDEAINTLKATRGSPGPCVICDEFDFENKSSSDSLRYYRFVKLCTRIPNVCMWVASPYHNQRPAELQEERMTTPLRCPPAVLSEVQKAVNSYRGCVYPYTKTTLATPCDGPKVIHLSHEGPEHSGRWPLKCVKCGQSIAGILQRLGVGLMNSGVNNHISTVITTATTANSHTNTVNANTTIVCPPLQYRDVFVLTRNLNPCEDVKDEEGRVTRRASGVVRGLRDAGIPVRVVGLGQKLTHVPDTVERNSDMVTVTNYTDVSGLERKVVVWLPDRLLFDADNNITDEQRDNVVRFYAMSRCTAQLVVIDVPYRCAPSCLIDTVQSLCRHVVACREGCLSVNC